MQIKSTLAAMKPELQERFGVTSLGLFGSVTRRDFTPQSDIDIVVSFSGRVGMNFFSLADLLEERLQSKVDLISSRGIKPNFLEEIKDDLVYV